MPHLTTYRQAHLACSLGVKVGTAHRALADTEVLAQIFDRLLRMAPDHDVSFLEELIEKFGVEKPVFRINQGDQPTLF